MAAGPTLAFEVDALYRQYYPMVVRVMRERGEVDVESAAHALFGRAMERGHEFREAPSKVTWLFALMGADAGAADDGHCSPLDCAKQLYEPGVESGGHVADCEACAAKLARMRSEDAELMILLPEVKPKRRFRASPVNGTIGFITVVAVMFFVARCEGDAVRDDVIRKRAQAPTLQP